MSSLYHPIDIYCERVTQDLLAEPVNALSNLSFFIAAYLLVKALKSSPIKHGMQFNWLVVLVFLIAVGSSAFHLFANRLTMLMDVIPITLFLLSYIWVFARLVGEQSVFISALWLGGFLLLGSLTGYVPEAIQMNGTIGYVPALLYLYGMSVIAKRKQFTDTANYLKGALLIFILSMTMRSIDMIICEYIPIGSHFLWHILNGVVLYKAVKALIVAKQQIQVK